MAISEIAKTSTSLGSLVSEIAQHHQEMFAMLEKLIGPIPGRDQIMQKSEGALETLRDQLGCRISESEELAKAIQEVLNFFS